jgi:hypothetical protein
MDENEPLRKRAVVTSKMKIMVATNVGNSLENRGGSLENRCGTSFGCIFAFSGSELNERPA